MKWIVLAGLLGTAPAYSSEQLYKALWLDSKGKHEVTLSVDEIPATEKDSRSLAITGLGTLNGEQEWVLYDSVTNCNLDMFININPTGFEVVELTGKGDYYLLLSYSMTCRGGLDPGDVKYFAYRDGKKFALRGVEHFVADGKPLYPEEKPVPVAGENLKKHPELYRYMMKKWPELSTVVIQ
ncbi:M949_RS01915 family surface polysaccharide biosynthesis protein [Aeromonas hydrophila]|uniref:M949_RS01915 family surface polysaccharide biosynthesis protein n=1 Tax=Aeromonas hydrophila TaxID=644 RepID=UPI003D25D0EA